MPGRGAIVALAVALGLAAILVLFMAMGLPSRDARRSVVYEVTVPSGRVLRLEIFRQDPAAGRPPLRFMPGDTLPIAKVRMSALRRGYDQETFSSHIGTEVVRVAGGDAVGTASVGAGDTPGRGLSTFARRDVRWESWGRRASARETAERIAVVLAEIPAENRDALLEFLLFRTDELEVVARETGKIERLRLEESFFDRFRAAVTGGIDLSLVPAP
jgi:hypothetical protein